MPITSARLSRPTTEDAGERAGLVRVASTVQRLTMRVWFNDLSRGLGSRRQAFALLTALGAILIGYSVWVGQQSSELLGGDNLEGLEGTYGAVFFVIPALTAIVAHLYAPPRTVISEMLSVLPVHRRVVQLTTRSLTATVGLMVALIVLGPLWIPLLLSRGIEGAVVATALLLVALAGIAVGLGLVVLLEFFLTRGLRMPQLAAQGFAGLGAACALAFLFVQALPMNRHEPSGPLLWMTERWVRWADGRGALLDAAPLTLALAAGVAVVVALDASASSSQTQSPVVPLLRRTDGPAKSSLVTLELLQAVRYPPNLLFLAFVNGTALLGIAAMRASGEDQLGLGLIVLTMISAWGVGMYGPTRRHHWIYRALGRPHAWVLPKLAAAALLWVAMVATQGVLLVSCTDWALRDLLVLLPTLFVELLIGCTVGILLPVDRNTSIGGALSEAIAMLMVVAASSVVQTIVAGLTTKYAVVAVEGAFLVAAVLAYLGSAYRATGHSDA